MKLPISDIKPNDDNPRSIRDDNFAKLVQSIKDFPEMAEVREIVLNKDHLILGGNMRFKAMVAAGWTEAPVKIVDWPEAKQKEFIIKDNVSGGDWDWDLLANEWDALPLEDWGLTLPVTDMPSMFDDDVDKSGDTRDVVLIELATDDYYTVKEDLENVLDGVKHNIKEL
jgi:ParB-like chromosome segregation protein Spo0J